MGTIKNFRTTADVTMNTKLKDGGVYIDWASLTDIRAWIYSDAQKALAGRADVTIDQQDSTKAVLVYAGTKAQYPGINRLIIQARYNGSLKTYDKAVFNFVPRTAEATGNVTIDEPETDVEIVVQDVSSSILDATILAALSAADRANDAAEAAEHMVDIHQGPPGEDGKSPYIGENGHWYEWDEDAGEYVDTETEAQGETGTTPDITIGTVTTAEPGTPAAATITGTPEAPVLNLTIPKGVAGDTPAFTVGEVTTGQPGTPVVVTITGTAAAPVLNIQIPQGLQGNTGSSVDYPFELVNNATTNDATKAATAAVAKGLKDDITQLEHELTEINTQDIPNAIYEDTFIQPINYELGNITIGATWTYSASTKRVRTPQGYVLHLFPGDVVGLTDYTNARFYLGVQFVGGGYTASGWKTQDYTIDKEGYVCILVSNLTEVVQSSADALGGLIRVTRNHPIGKKVKDLENGQYQLNQEIGVLLKGKYTYEFYVSSNEHSSTADTLPVSIKAGDTIKVKVRQGTGVCDGQSVWCYLLDENLQATQARTALVIGTETTIVATAPAVYIGIYLYKNTTYGTFYLDVQLSAPSVREWEIDELKANKGAVALLLSNGTAPDIDTTNRTLTIIRGSAVIFNKGNYLIPNGSDVVVSLAGIPSGNKKVIFDKSNNSFSCKAYNVALTETQGVIMLIKTDYAADGNFTSVQSVTAPFDVTIDGEGKFPVGTITGYGKIALQSKFKEITHSLSITQTIFDTNLYSVGVQSFGLFQDSIGVYIINATDINNSSIQKIGAVIVDLENNAKLGEFEIPTTNTKAHGNNMNFGAKYDEDDTLPLVYVSMTYNPYECEVYRIANDFSTYTHIQTIVYGGTAHFANKNTIDWIVDGKYIWAYGSYWDANSEYIEFVKFAKPETSDASVSLTDADVLDSFMVKGLRISQGAIIKNDKIYIGLGYTSGVEFIKVVDIPTRAVEAVVPLSYEPEGVSVFNDQLAVSRSGLSFQFRTYIDAY